MRVVCINDEWEWSNGMDTPVKGDIDVVIDEDCRFGFLAYAFERFGPTEFYNADHFVPISEFTIEELVGEIQELQEV